MEVERTKKQQSRSIAPNLSLFCSLSSSPPATRAAGATSVAASSSPRKLERTMHRNERKGRRGCSISFSIFFFCSGCVFSSTVFQKFFLSLFSLLFTLSLFSLLFNAIRACTCGASVSFAMVRFDSSSRCAKKKNGGSQSLFSLPLSYFLSLALALSLSFNSFSLFIPAAGSRSPP